MGPFRIGGTWGERLEANWNFIKLWGFLRTNFSSYLSGKRKWDPDFSPSISVKSSAIKFGMAKVIIPKQGIRPIEFFSGAGTIAILNLLP